jgi:fucose permease
MQPWIQALHACWGVGALSGPSVVGAFGYVLAFRLFAMLSAIPLVLIIVLRGNSKKLYLTNSDSETLRSVVSVFHDAEFNDADKVTYSEVLTDDSPVKESVSENSILVPIIIRVLMAFFFFLYVGIETGFGGWIPTYALDSGIVTQESEASYMASVFYGSLALGRIISIFVAIFFSSTAMIRYHLCVCALGSLLFLFDHNSNASTVYLSAAILGYGLSCIFPVMLVLFTDYGMQMLSHF